MEKNEFRAVIKHFYIKRNTTKEIKAELNDVCGTSAPSFKTVCNSVNELKRGRTVTTVSLTREDASESVAQMPNVILLARRQVLICSTEWN